jgi:hypothetical protein
LKGGKRLDGNHKFAIFYITVVSVASVGSLYASILNPAWHHAVFTFPPEIQKVVENGTAVMDIQWRWLPETLEIMVKVNDDKANASYVAGVKDRAIVLFDSDKNGNLTTGWGNYDYLKFDDHGVFLSSEGDTVIDASGAVMGHCWVDAKGHIYEPFLSGWFYELVTLDNTTTCTFEDGKGYTFNASIPIKYINVTSPTHVIINYVDADYIYSSLGPEWLEREDEGILVAQLWM